MWIGGQELRRPPAWGQEEGGPGSLTWQAFGEFRLLLLSIQAFLFWRLNLG